MEEGADARGRATVTPPNKGQNGTIWLEALSAIGVTGEPISLFGNEASHGTTDCIEFGCLLFPWENGGPASMDPGLQFEARVAQGVTLHTDALRAYQNRKLDQVKSPIENCRVRLALCVYQPADSKMKSAKIFIDGTELGRVPPGTMRSLVPKPGTHVISANQNHLSVEFQECTAYYIKLLQKDSGRKSNVEIRVVRSDIGKEEVRDLWEIENNH
jgi:hypothetical protein